MDLEPRRAEADIPPEEEERGRERRLREQVAEATDKQATEGNIQKENSQKTTKRAERTSVPSSSLLETTADSNSSHSFPDSASTTQPSDLIPSASSPTSLSSSSSSLNAEKLKEEANAIYRAADWTEAAIVYTRALRQCSADQSNLKAIILANRAACHLQMENFEGCLQDCTEAILHNPTYAKAYFRRFKANERLTKRHDALSDLNKAMELDDKIRADNIETQKRVERESKEQFEKEKEEMLGKMKEFGNFLLGKVGLSTDNFKMEQNESGSYNIQFQPTNPAKKTSTT